MIHRYIFGLTRGGLSARFGRVIFEGPSAPIDCNIIGPPSTILNSGIKSILKNFVLNIDRGSSILLPNTALAGREVLPYTRYGISALLHI
jgi:hypothetical protein